MNKWIKYSDRSYASIKTSVNERLNDLTPELVDKSPSNLMQVIVDIFAGIGELLNYYIDIAARELFLPTARRFSSVLNLASLADYNGRAKLPARAIVEVTYKDPPEENPADITITPINTFADDDGNIWTPDATYIFQAGYWRTFVEVIQREENIVNNSGVVIAGGSLLPNPYYEIPSDYENNSSLITIAAVDWERVDSLGYSSATDKHYVVKLLSDGQMYAMFGDGTKGAAPSVGATVILTYNRTLGATGNIGSEAITTSPTSLTSDLKSTNPSEATGGKEIEGIQDLRKAIPISLRTLNRAVTKQDYEDVANMAPGVRAARVKYSCGTGVEIFVVGETSGDVTPGQITAEILPYIENRSMMSVVVTVKPSGESHIIGVTTITGKYRAKEAAIRTAVDTALGELYDPKVTDINQPVRLSDIIATIDNVSLVNYMSLDSVYIQPYLRYVNNPTAVLTYTIEVLIGSTQQIEWSITKNAGGNYDVNRGGLSVGGALVVGATGTYGPAGGVDEVKITIITDGGAITNDVWNFTVYPYDSDVVLDDMSIPVIDPGDFTHNIIETYIT